jgi:uncharacterized protein (TIGR03435 family)
MFDVASLATLLAKVTVAVSLGLVLLRCASRQSAAVRHAMASTTLAAAVVMPIAGAWLPSIPVVLKTREVRSPVVASTNDSAALDNAAHAASPASARGPALSTILLVGWAAGATLCLLPALAAGYQSRRLRAEGRAWTTAEAAVASPSGRRRLQVPVLLHDGLSSPVACGAFSPAIVLPTSSRTWDALDIERALVHELAHVKRGDVLVHALARTVCAAYWFHPLVWLCWRRLRVEAERACDDAVLERFESAAYAAQLVRLARRTQHDQLAVALPSMARPGELTTRVESILDVRQVRSRLGGGRAMPIALLGASFAAWLACLHPTVAAVVRAPASRSPTFATVSVRESAPEASMTLVRDADGSLRLTAATLRVLIRLAYGVQDDAIVDAPAWMASARYTIAAASPGRAAAGATLPMLQALLAEHFGLRVSHEWRRQRVFVLRVPADAPGLQPPTRCSPTLVETPDGLMGVPGALPPCGFHVTPGRIQATGVDAQALAATLSTPLGGQVIVESPGPDRFDTRLVWPAGDPARLVEALRTQFGATVSEQHRRVPVIAIRSVRRPA